MASKIFSLVGKIALDGGKSVNDQLKAANEKTHDLRKGLGQLGAALGNAGKNLSKNLSLPLAAVGTAIGALAFKTSSYASDLLSLNEATGLATDTLQELRHVATAAGTSADGMFGVISKLSNKLPEIAQGTGGAAVALDKLGISVTNADGSLRSMDSIYPEIINGLQSIEDKTLRNTIAQDIFGGSIKDLAPVLGMSADEMAKLRTEAHKLGKVQSGEALQSADKFRAGVENLKGQVAAIGIEIGMGFMPILNDKLIPLINGTVIPIIRFMGDSINWVSGIFAALPTPIQGVIFGLLGLVAAAGPTALIAGKLFLTIKNLIPVLVTMGGALKTATAASLKFAAAAAVNPYTWVAAAIVALGYLFIKTKQLNDETERLNKESEKQSQQTRELYNTAKAAEKVVKEYKKLEGTDAFDPKELEHLVNAHLDCVVALKNHNQALQDKQPLNDKEIEKTRQNVLALHGLKDAHADATKGMTDYQRAQFIQQQKDEAEALKRRGEAWAEAEKKRKEDLKSTLETHQDSLDKMMMSETEYLFKQEAAELAKLDKLKATEEQKNLVRELYYEQYQEIVKKQNEDEEKAAADKAQKIADINESTALKLLNQQEDSLEKQLKLNDIQYAADLAAAAEAGADVNGIHEYYAIEQFRIKKDFADKEIALDKEVADKAAEAAKKKLDDLKALYNNIGSSIVGAVNSIGGILAGMGRNEEKRISKQYKQQRDFINANVKDEEERAKQLEALNEEEEAKKLALQKKALKREKALGVFNTIINTAQAVMKSIASLGPIAGPIMGAVMAGIGAAQIGVILSEPEPFAAGGLVSGGRGGIIGQIGEGQQDELILPMETGVQKLAAELAEMQSGGTTTNNSPVNIVINGYFGTEKELKDLERRLGGIRAAEAKRTGTA